MCSDFGDKLSKDEKKAVEALIEAGWTYLEDISIERAKPLGERFPLYTAGGLYSLGIVRRMDSKPPASRPVKKSKSK